MGNLSSLFHSLSQTSDGYGCVGERAIGAIASFYLCRSLDVKQGWNDITARSSNAVHV